MKGKHRERRVVSGRWRHLSLVLIGVVVGLLMLGPVQAHFTTNTRHLAKHAWQQFIKQKAAWHLKYVRGDQVSQNANIFDYATVMCPSGWYATGGGAATDAGNFDLEASYPTNGVEDMLGRPLSGRTGWAVGMDNEGSTTLTFRPYVVCTQVAKITGTNGAAPAVADTVAPNRSG